MNKEQFADEINERIPELRLTHEKALKIVTAIFDANDGIIARELAKRNGELALAGFGQFYTHILNARNARNPHSGEAMVARAKRVVRFKAGKTLKAKIESRPLPPTPPPAPLSDDATEPG